ncbi:MULTISPECIES: hypothetical protein [unclassified Cryobacterium]|uniref:hypothetical protein n=1 Tax=unclassified Cryobacterium TaxID=2649013 RepID=UPI002AB4B512|nr:MULTISPECIES: hypothetical protein [unclassified Cryobacterium]MDY7541313.1 hypothetical protein [Cryobacterium sp. 5B3]MEA9998113.1 hypothetical protein [Cryobacterium sp. RTS3]MEB0265303.1 hypothetical protein [Cryobacterium sp. 10I5]MEB0273388.1 hypothetical protein [Cryobacterium sp. 5B3]
MHRTLLSLFACLTLLCAVLVAGSSTASASPAGAAPRALVGSVSATSVIKALYASWTTTFTQKWGPYGNCGVPVAQLDTASYAALNTYSASGGTGAYNNGSNCGRMITVAIGGTCINGDNSGGNVGKGFCVGGTVVNDAYTGATQTYQIADSCPDYNNWCWNDRYHLDLAQSSLGNFVKAGKVLTGLGASWNNRQVTWSYTSAPNYTGDIKIGFRKDAQRYWNSIVITHLKDGISTVQYLQDGVWRAATMSGQVGQLFTIGATVAGGSAFQIRAFDANGIPIKAGTSYKFSFPASCGALCTAAYTPVAYSH